MPGPLRVTRSVVIPERELRWRFSRSSGPGGQGVNTADSRVELSLDLARTTALGPVQRARVLERLRRRLVDGVLTVTASEQRIDDVPTVELPDWKEIQSSNEDPDPSRKC